MRFPNFIQPDTTDCGPTCLRIISKFYKREFNIVMLRELMFKSRDGVSLLAISDAAEHLGFRTQGCKLTFQTLSQANLPCIAHWKQNHFVVVYKIKGNSIYVSDPRIGLIKYTTEEFINNWSSGTLNNQHSGIVLLLMPTPNFYLNKGNDKQGIDFSYLLEYLLPYKSLTVQLLLSFVAGSLLSLIFPFLTQAIIDTGIVTHDLNFITLVVIAQLVLSIGQTSIEFIRNWLMLYLTSRVSISIISDFIAKLMKLPIRFFDSKVIGDITQRMSDNSRIQSFLTNNLISMSFSAFIFIIYSVILWYYQWRILCIFYLGSFLYIFWIVLFLRKRKELDYKKFSESTINQSNLYEMITGMQDIKLNGFEKQRRWQWERIQARMFQLSVQTLGLGQNQQAGSSIINQVKNILISYFTAKAVIDGEITLGVMFSIQYILGQLNSPVIEAIEFIQSAQDARISLERLGEIHLKKDEETLDEDKISNLPNDKTIDIQDMSFQYDGPRSTRILDKINLTIPAGKVTALVGSSGSGKTTLLKIMLGFYSPTEGAVRVGALSLSQISLSAWRRTCGVVMQEGFIFSDTIIANIAIGEETPDKEKLLHAVTMSNVRDFAENLPLKYNTKIGMEGVGLSSGQKQRILIARAIYKNPEYIFLDEATNALDARNETLILSNLDVVTKNKTVVVVAHRLSTVKDADQIVVLKQGRIVEKGTHRELINQNGEYHNLVLSQLQLRE